MKILNDEGCVLCQSTWGNYTRKLGEQELFFCCSKCANIFEIFLQKIYEKMGITRIETLLIEGSPRKREFFFTTPNQKFTGSFKVQNERISDIIFDSKEHFL